MRLTLTIALAAALCGCGKEHPKAVKAAPAAKVENGGVREADLARITLTPEAARRLGIETGTIENKDAREMRTWSGDVTVPPGQAVTVAAPVTGTLQHTAALAPGLAVKAGDPLFRIVPLLAAERDLRANREAEASVASARVDAARLRLERAERLLRDQTGSVKAVETAREELTVAEAGLAAARQKLELAVKAPYQAEAAIQLPAPQSGILRQILANPGQVVAAGAPLVELARLDTVWLRVPVYAGEIGRIDRAASAEVRPLGAPLSTRGRPARPVAAPPTADPLAATTDLYYQFENPGLQLRPGERLSVTLPLKGAVKRLQAPWAAVLYDVHGGAWVYEAASDTVFLRRKVEVDYTSGASAILSHGPKPGTRVVTAGAAELFGTEFGPGK